MRRGLRVNNKLRVTLRGLCVGDFEEELTQRHGGKRKRVRGLKRMATY